MRYFSSYERLILKQFSNKEELKRTKVISMSEQTGIFFGGEVEGREWERS